MQKSSFFNAIISESGVPDKAYLAEDFARYFNSFIGNGVFPNPVTGLQVVAVDSNMDIRIRQGKGWINGYFYENTDDYTLKIDVADGVLNRIDRVVLRLDFLSREIKAYVKKGTYSSTPIAPGLTRDADMYELGIADIRVSKGIIKLTQADITDLRFNTSLCGIVTGVVDQIDTTNLFAQYQNEFDIWFKNVQTQLGEDVAGSLQNQITQNKIDINKKVDDIKIATDKKIADNKTDINKKVDDFTATKGKPNGLATLGIDGLVTYNQLPKSSIVFNTPGTHIWTVPEGVTTVQITAVAGGGGGGSGTLGSNGNGGSGGVTSFGTVFALNGGGGGKGGKDSYKGAAGEGGKGMTYSVDSYNYVFGGLTPFISKGVNGTDSVGGVGIGRPLCREFGEGGEGSKASPGGGGGGGGSYCLNFLVYNVSPYSKITITIGTGGTAGDSYATNGVGGFMKIEW